MMDLAVDLQLPFSSPFATSATSAPLRLAEPECEKQEHITHSALCDVNAQGWSPRF